MFKGTSEGGRWTQNVSPEYGYDHCIPKLKSIKICLAAPKVHTFVNHEIPLMFSKMYLLN